MLKNYECDSSFPVVHPRKPDKGDLMKETIYSLMPYSDKKPSIMLIPAMGQNGNQQEVLKEVIPYPRSCIQTVIEKNSHSKNIRYEEERCKDIRKRKPLKNRQLVESCTTSECNGNIVHLSDDRDTMLTEDDRQLSNTGSLSEEDSNFQLESLLKEMDHKKITVSQYQHLLFNHIKELNIISCSLGTEATSVGFSKQISTNHSPDIENFSNIELLLRNATCNVEASVTRLLSEGKIVKLQLNSLLEDHELYEKQTSRLKKKLTSFLRKLKKTKDDNELYDIEFPIVQKLTSSSED